VPDAYVVHQGEAAQAVAWKTVRYLRDRGFRAILHCGAGNFKAQMKKADSSNARYAIIIGEDEVRAEEVSV
jgi:histidyl-tRNA synthetase